jgi:hypothetical protein
LGLRELPIPDACITIRRLHQGDTAAVCTTIAASVSGSGRFRSVLRGCWGRGGARFSLCMRMGKRVRDVCACLTDVVDDAERAMRGRDEPARWDFESSSLSGCGGYVTGLILRIEKGRRSQAFKPPLIAKTLKRTDFHLMSSALES